MKFGVCIPNYGETLSVDGMRTVALEAERLGYESVWTTDHLLMEDRDRNKIGAQPKTQRQKQKRTNKKPYTLID
jgi:alkanesulfonate monooxygenase SsuD/methylene tetrahydromethanopterin reductase-like flavin-dependent oxidoreductase (luciferase family)